MYMMTPEQHAQIVELLVTSLHHIPADDTGLKEDTYAAISMLKAMQPVSPVGWWDTIDGGDFTYSIGELCGGPTDGLHPLYTPTKD
jgi:hypothetical protein